MRPNLKNKGMQLWDLYKAFQTRFNFACGITPVHGLTDVGLVNMKDLLKALSGLVKDLSSPQEPLFQLARLHKFSPTHLPQIDTEGYVILTKTDFNRLWKGWYYRHQIEGDAWNTQHPALPDPDPVQVVERLLICNDPAEDRYFLVTNSSVTPQTFALYPSGLKVQWQQGWFWKVLDSQVLKAEQPTPASVRHEDETIAISRSSVSHIFKKQA